VVFDLTEKPDFKLIGRSGNQIIVELNDINSTSLGKFTGESSLVKNIQVRKIQGRMAVQLILDVVGATSQEAFALPPVDNYGHRLVIDITDKALAAIEAAPRATKTKVTKGRPIVIAIDAGHGGHDPGAIGKKGTYEKNVTFAIAQKLQALINKESGFKAVMVRTGDYYIYPSKRPDVARDLQADMLVSIHADAAENRKASGASVWVLSLKRATTEVGKMMEQTEQHSELLGGVAEVIKDSANEKYLAQMVLDLSMNHSMSAGFDVAELVLEHLEDVTKLHKEKPQAASLGVLKAPDIPSILVETGYISNINEEQKLKSPSHQQKLATAIFKGLKTHFYKSPPADTSIAMRTGKEPVGAAAVEPATAPVEQPTVAPATNLTGATKPGPVVRQPGPIVRQVPVKTTTSSKKPAAESSKAKTHKVKSGESLSLLASRYGVSMAQLRKHNNLKSDQIQIGQVLRIP
jgi:N-acetylmuramoyl-L-alanine amidase